MKIRKKSRTVASFPGTVRQAGMFLFRIDFRRFQSLVGKQKPAGNGAVKKYHRYGSNLRFHNLGTEDHAVFYSAPGLLGGFSPALGKQGNPNRKEYRYELFP